VTKRRLMAENSKWRVYFDDVEDGDGRQISDYLVVAPRIANKDLITGVVVLPVMEDGRIVLLRVWRHAIERSGWEVVRGFVDAGESVAQAAARELLEETGLICAPENLVELGFCVPEGSTIRGRGALFAALRCRPAATAADGEFGIEECRSFSRREVEVLTAGPEIEDAATLVALYRYSRLYPDPPS